MIDELINILLVEDNEDDIIMTMESFQEAGVQSNIDVVRDGVSALEYLQQHQSFQTMLPDMILLDINMPKKSGFEVLKEIKSNVELRHIPIIMLTTSEREEDVIRSYAEGACSYIPKPVGFEQFVETIKGFSIYWTRISRIPK